MLTFVADVEGSPTGVVQSQYGYRRIWTCRFPLWVPTAAFLLCPAMWLRRYTSHKRSANERRCLTCGYDLRATPGRCPECGMVPHAAR